MSYVRRYVDGDWPQVIALARMFHVESPIHCVFPFAEERVEVLIKGAVANRDWLPAVCVDNGMVIGIMLLFHMPMFFSHASEVGDLTFYVVPEKRGTRAALQMMKFGEDWATAIRASVMRFGITTGISDDSIQRFYEKCGFRQVGVQMEKRL